MVRQILYVAGDDPKDIGQTVDSPKAGWNEAMLDHRVPGVRIDPHSIEEAENIIESFLMQASHSRPLRVHRCKLLAPASKSRKIDLKPPD